MQRIRPTIREADILLVSAGHIHIADMQQNSDDKSFGSREGDGTMHTPYQPNNRHLLKLGAAALILAATLPFIQQPVPTESNAAPSVGVDSRAVPIERKIVLETRADSPTDVCTRWSHQSAVINGTLYIYGGQATTEPGQTQNTWSKDVNSRFL